MSTSAHNPVAGDATSSQSGSSQSGYGDQDASSKSAEDAISSEGTVLPARASGSGSGRKRQSAASKARVPRKAKNQEQGSFELGNFSYPADVSLKTLLEAGAHFGHQTDKWNPKMAPYIYTAKNGVHIINLDKSLEQWKLARQYIIDTVSAGGSLLYVGTKLQVREIVEHEAKRVGAYYVTSRWLGGTLSNFKTIKNSIDRMRKLEDLLSQAEEEGTKIKLTKKEKLEMSRELEKLEASLGGIRNLRKVPDVIFVIDVVKEAIAVNEARRLRIPVIALVDTNAQPDDVHFPIACNDDATRAVRLLCAAVGDAVLEGRAFYEARMAQGARGDHKDHKGKSQGNSGGGNGGTGSAGVTDGSPEGESAVPGFAA